MKKLLIIFCSIILIASCGEDKVSEGITDSKFTPSSASATGDDWVWVTNHKEIQIYNPANTWVSTNPIWRWKPESKKDYSDFAIAKWNKHDPRDFKVRHIAKWGGNFLAAVGGDLATIAEYPSGMKKWAFSVGDWVAPHSVELLPSGNIVVAGTNKNWVKVFASSTGIDNTTHSTFKLVGAHSVLWDPSILRLWALGSDSLVALEVEDDSTPKFKRDPNRKYRLPRPIDPSKPGYGHDMSTDLNNSNLLWISVNGGVYYFSKFHHKFYEAPGKVNKSFVKGISRQASGEFVITRADSEKDDTSNLDNAVLDPKWYTGYVDFYSADGSKFLYYKTFKGAKFYKGKIFRTKYID